MKVFNPTMAGYKHHFIEVVFLLNLISYKTYRTVSEQLGITDVLFPLWQSYPPK